MNLKFYKCSVEPTGAENGAVWFDTTNSKIYVKEDGYFVEYSKQEKPLILNGEYKTVENSEPTEYTINVTTQDESPLFSTIKSALTSQRPIYLFVSTKLSFGSMYYTSSEGVLIPLEAVHHYDKYYNNEKVTLTANFYFLGKYYDLLFDIDNSNNLNTYIEQRYFLRQNYEKRFYIDKYPASSYSLITSYLGNTDPYYLLTDSDVSWTDYNFEKETSQDWDIKGDSTE